MTTSTATFTASEIAILKGCKNNEFCNAFDGDSPWVFAVISESGLDAKVARGAIASLVRKCIIAISDYGSKNSADDMILTLTERGLSASKHLKF